MNNKVKVLLQYFLILFILCSCNNKKQKNYEEKCEKKIEIATPSNEYYEETKKDKKELNYIDSNINKFIFDEGLLSQKDIIYMMCFEKKTVH